MNRTPMTARAFVLLLLLAGCSQQPPTKICVEVAHFEVIPAPPGETPLERWRRTQTNWEEANHAAESAASESYRQKDAITSPYFAEYMDAEKALQKLQCGKLCKPGETS